MTLLLHYVIKEIEMYLIIAILSCDIIK